jgi:hypothetical protein
MTQRYPSATLVCNLLAKKSPHKSSFSFARSDRTSLGNNAPLTYLFGRTKKAIAASTYVDGAYAILAPVLHSRLYD